MSIKIDEDETRCVIRFEGDLDVSGSAEMKSALIAALATRKKFILDFAKAGELDVTAVQLLWAAKREADKLGIAGALAGELPPYVESTLNEAGFENFLMPAAEYRPEETSKSLPGNGEMIEPTDD